MQEVIVNQAVPSDTENHPFGYSLNEMDTEAFINLRTWLTEALYAAGAKYGGGSGIGMGQADIDIELESHRYNVSIKPLPRP